MILSLLGENNMDFDCEKVANRIENFIRDKMNEFQREGVILGMSGGIDSSITATLAVRALGPEKVLALILPERDSSPESKTDALKEIKRLGIQYRELKLGPILSKIGLYKLIPLKFLGTKKIKEFVVKRQHDKQAETLGEMPFRAGLLGTRNLGKQKKVIDAGNAYARVKHRMRLIILYYYADLENRLVLGTTNKSESMTGFIVKWGDNVADIEPILPLYKTQVWQLAEYLGLPQEIIDRAPTPDLMPGIVDETALGIDYNTLDKILWSIERGWDNRKIQSDYYLEEEMENLVYTIDYAKSKGMDVSEIEPLVSLVYEKIAKARAVISISLTDAAKYVKEIEDLVAEIKTRLREAGIEIIEKPRIPLSKKLLILVVIISIAAMIVIYLIIKFLLEAKARKERTVILKKIKKQFIV